MNLKLFKLEFKGPQCTASATVIATSLAQARTMVRQLQHGEDVPTCAKPEGEAIRSPQVVHFFNGDWD